MVHFPVFMDVSTKKWIIFGGGKVAFRKVESLLRYQANIEIISRQVTDEIKKLLPHEQIHETEIGPDQMEYWLKKADFVIAATGDRQLNHEISSWCREHNILVNVIDAPEECSFLFPSVVTRGDISIGINTGGNSPIVSKKIRKDIEEVIPDYYGDIADQLGWLRDYVKNHYDLEKDRRQILKRAASLAFEKKAPLNEEELHELLSS